MCFFLQAEDGIRGAQESRGLGDVYKRQYLAEATRRSIGTSHEIEVIPNFIDCAIYAPGDRTCLLYTSDAADDLLCVDIGGRRSIKKNLTRTTHIEAVSQVCTDLNLHQL